MEAESARPRARSRLVLVLLVVLFAGPILFAYWLNVFHPGWRPFGQSNHGSLVTPSYWVGLPGVLGDSGHLNEEGRWILLHAVSGRCDRACRSLLIATRQIRISLGKDASRVVRVAVREASDEEFDWSELAAEHPDLVARTVGAEWMRAAFAAPIDDRNQIVLIDPNGYAVLRYGIDLDPKGLSKDLGRLLKISKIG